MTQFTRMHARIAIIFITFIRNNTIDYNAALWIERFRTRA